MGGAALCETGSSAGRAELIQRGAGARAEDYRTQFGEAPGGIRRGIDVLKALAFGARAVLVGRPVLWGLTLDGTDGVRAVLQHMRAEVDLAMALAGCRTVADITRDLIV